VTTPVPLVAWIAAAGFLLLSAAILAGTLRTSAPPRRGLLIALALGGAAVRVLLWWFSIGSNDTLIGRSHALHILALDKAPWSRGQGYNYVGSVTVRQSDSLWGLRMPAVNFYWGAITNPLLAFGLVWPAPALRDL
jgi:hypothetical protein